MAIYGRAETGFINPKIIRQLLAGAEPSSKRVDEILGRASALEGLTASDAASLLSIEDPMDLRRLLDAAGSAKEAIYGRRMVVFAPLYISNRCANDCLYCAFRVRNPDLVRRSLSLDEVEAEARALLREGHKRVLLLSGEGEDDEIGRLTSAIGRVYAARLKFPGGSASIRRVNVEVAPMGVDDFRLLKGSGIGTYACFQETYDPELYETYHPSGPKKDYANRLMVMHRAMEAGIDDVGLGALFGLGDFRFEVLGLLAHAAELERAFGCGCHTVSVPRIEPAVGAPVASEPPRPVTDNEFRKVIAVLRLALPYAGIILSTREREELRGELFRYGVSQISAGSRTNPGAYAAADPVVHGATSSEGQFQLGDHRSLAEVTRALATDGYVPSFCTGCYRKGRTGADFMELAKPGLIKRFCEPNALFTYAEYLADFGSAEDRAVAERLFASVTEELPDEETKAKVRDGLAAITDGARDMYL